MDIQTARQTAKNWTDLFCSTFYVIELANGIYDVAARVMPRQKVVAPDPRWVGGDRDSKRRLSL